MICPPCARGADFLSIPAEDIYPGDVDIARRYHAVCEGCDCQHRVDLQAEGRSVRT